MVALQLQPVRMLIWRLCPGVDGKINKLKSLCWKDRCWLYDIMWQRRQVADDFFHMSLSGIKELENDFQMSEMPFSLVDMNWKLYAIELFLTFDHSCMKHAIFNIGKDAWAACSDVRFTHLNSTNYLLSPFTIFLSSEWFFKACVSANMLGWHQSAGPRARRCKEGLMWRHDIKRDMSP